MRMYAAEDMLIEAVMQCRSMVMIDLFARFGTEDAEKREERKRQFLFLEFASCIIIYINNSWALI